MPAVRRIAATAQLAAAGVAVGGYALAFRWPDGHDTGIYPYDLLRRICPCDECAARREAGGEADDRARFLRMERED